MSDSRYLVILYSVAAIVAIGVIAAVLLKQQKQQMHLNQPTATATATATATGMPMPMVPTRVRANVSPTPTQPQPQPQPQPLTCTAGSAADLDALCSATGFAGYDTQLEKCYSLAQCTTQPCDAAYCTSESVKSTLGNVVKQRTDYNTCQNPTEAQVAAMCQQQPDAFWRTPNCYKYAVQNTITINVQGATPPTTNIMYATLSHPLLNAGDAPVSYSFRLLKEVQVSSVNASASVSVSAAAAAPAPDIESVTWVKGDSAVVTGFSTAPPFQTDADAEGTAVAATAIQTQLQLVRSGNVTVLSPCTSGNGTSGNTGLNTCVNVVIYLTSSTPLAEGVYTLQINGTPAWNPSSILYQLTDPAGISIYLLPAQNGAGVNSALNPVLTATKAQQLAANQAWADATLQTLSTLPLTAPLIQKPLQSAPLAYVEPQSTEKALLVGCTPLYCKAAINQVRQKMVVLAWDAITPAQVTAARANAACTNSDPAATYVKYLLLRAASNSTATAGSGASFVELIGPSTQPLQALVGGTTLSFVDVLPINTFAQYILAAYLVKSASDTTTYAQAGCKSQQVYASVNVGDYSAAFCHSMKGPQPLLLPPWYWRDPATGMCQWTEKAQGARDYYCMFEAGTGKNPAANFNTRALSFATSTESCQAAVPQFAKPATVWSNASCTPASAGGPYSDATCVSGATEQVGASCTAQIQAGDYMSESDFSRRLSQVADFYATNNTYSGTEAALASISGTDNQKALWNTYSRCGPALQPDTWGTNVAACGDDPVCVQYATMGGCDRNYCAPWVEQGAGSGIYRQTRTCYPPASLDGAKSKCCNSVGTYAVDTNVTSARGKCTNCGQTFSGAQCTESLCTGQTCSGHGTCVIDQQTNAARCECEPNYFNVTAKTRGYQQEDCELIPPGCQYYILDANNKVMRNSACIINPRKCKCPEVKEALLACTQNGNPSDPLVDPRTGCSIPMEYGKLASATNAYTFAAPDYNKFLVVPCLGNTVRPSLPNLGYPDYTCCSGKSKMSCKQNGWLGCELYWPECVGWNPPGV